MLILILIDVHRPVDWFIIIYTLKICKKLYDCMEMSLLGYCAQGFPSSDKNSILNTEHQLK